MLATPELRYLRLKQVLALIPISKTTWWKNVKENKNWPQPIKITKRTTAWLSSDIYKLIEQLNKQKGE